MQIPIGLEEFHEGVVDIVDGRAMYFKGNKGSEVVEGPVPAEMKQEMEKKRTELIERVSEVRWDITAKDCWAACQNCIAVHRRSAWAMHAHA